MVDRFKPSSMDCTSPGDLHKHFKLFKQNWEHIFAGPLDEVGEAKKAKLLLLWVGGKGLEMYNTSTWTNEGDDLKIAPVMAAL